MYEGRQVETHEDLMTPTVFFSGFLFSCFRIPPMDTQYRSLGISVKVVTLGSRFSLVNPEWQL
jgi:hypothetical protein